MMATEFLTWTLRDKEQSPSMGVSSVELAGVEGGVRRAIDRRWLVIGNGLATIGNGLTDDRSGIGIIGIAR